ncbi:MAG TPA: GcrA family cell cycle regulator [Verrucomicrobiae bacterium]|nr:GcrA family cell cycle regulator [Verrucomicrobiae bacterium]
MADTGCWTLEQSDALRGFVGEGFSYSETAHKINAQFGTAYTRNSAIGRANRIGLACPVRPGGGTVKRSAEEKIAARIERNRRANARYHAKMASRKPIDEVEFERKQAARESIEHYIAASIEELSEDNVRGIAALGDRHCRYPLNDDMSNPIFCGQRTFTEGASYCGFHQMRCHSPSTHTEQGAAK